MDAHIDLFDYLNDNKYYFCIVDSKQLNILVELMRNKHKKLRKKNKGRRSNLQQKLESLSFKNSFVIFLDVTEQEYQYLKEELLISINWSQYIKN